MLDDLTRYAVGTRLRGMCRFCRWLVAEGELEVAPTDGIEIPAPPEKPVPILTDDEIAALLKGRALLQSSRRPARPRQTSMTTDVYFGRKVAVTGAAAVLEALDT